MTERTLVLDTSVVVLTYPPAPAPRAAQPPDGSTSDLCPTGACAEAHRGRPGTEERARLARTVGALLRRERVGRGWTRTQLAAAAGVATSTLWRLERGHRRPSEAMSRRLAVALRAETHRPVDAAVLDLELQAAAGDSLRRLRRRYPVRERRRRLYDQAAEILIGRGPDHAAAVQAGMLLAVLDDAARRAKGRGHG